MIDAATKEAIEKLLACPDLNLENLDAKTIEAIAHAREALAGEGEKPSRLYDVTYSVTRGETYRIAAQSEDEAFDRAFEEGERIEEGDATDVATVDCVEVQEEGEKTP